MIFLHVWEDYRDSDPVPDFLIIHAKYPKLFAALGLTTKYAESDPPNLKIPSSDLIFICC